MKKLTKKLMLSILTVALTFIALGTSTFAWFSMNSEVAVTGMKVRTQVSNNLLITGSTAGTSKAADSAFVNGYHATDLDNQLIQPVSTTTALDDAFFWTDDAKADGSKLNTDLTEKPYNALTNNTIAINNVNYKGYVDYVFELKAINTNPSETTELKLTRLNLLYNGETTTNHAFRVAIFSQKAASADASTYPARDAADGIYGSSTAAYFNGKAVSATNAESDMTLTTATWKKTVAAGTTEYYKITVRLWLEGADTDCFNTKFVDLTADWSLDLKFVLGGETAAVGTIGSANSATLTGTTTLTAALAVPGETAVTYAFYKVGTDAAVQAASATATYSPSASGTYYCVLVTAKGNVYETPRVTVTIG